MALLESASNPWSKPQRFSDKNTKVALVNKTTDVGISSKLLTKNSIHKENNYCFVSKCNFFKKNPWTFEENRDKNQWFARKSASNPGSNSQRLSDKNTKVALGNKTTDFGISCKLLTKNSIHKENNCWTFVENKGKNHWFEKKICCIRPSVFSSGLEHISLTRS